MKTYCKISIAFIYLVILCACKKSIREWPSTNQGVLKANQHSNGNGFGTIGPEEVIRWNDAAVYVVLRTMQIQTMPRIPPFRESHYYAMVNLAMHNALNGIVPKYQRYEFNLRDKDANPQAAVAQAAHDVIFHFFGRLNPPANVTPMLIQDSIHQLLQQTLSNIPEGEAKQRGIALGSAAANVIIQARNNDGSANAIFTITQGTLPGQYRSTPPFDVTGFYDSPGWGEVKPFALVSNVQFPVPAPYPLASQEYAKDYEEVKTMGCNTCTGVGRTPDQEEIARFWVESSAFGWNKVAREVMNQKHMDAWKTARILALVQMSIADAYIASLKSKMIHFFWRPFTAIRQGDTDGNPATAVDPNWQVLVTPIPPIADHPSAHATAGGAAATTLRMIFDEDAIKFSFPSSSLMGKSRSYSSLSAAARENSLSRIYVGYHFRKACIDGEELGDKIGDWVVENYLQEN